MITKNQALKFVLNDKDTLKNICAWADYPNRPEKATEQSLKALLVGLMV